MKGIKKRNIALVILAFMFILLAAGAFSAEASSSLDAGRPALLAQSLAPSDVPTDPNAVIKKVTDYLIGISGAVAVLFIIIGGFRYMTSAGNEEAKEKAKKTITRAVIGLVIVILSYFIVFTVNNFLLNSP